MRNKGHACQHARQHLAGLCIVVDNQDAPAAQVWPREVPQWRSALAEAGGEPECASLAQLAGNPDITTHQLRQALGDGQPKSGSAELPGSRSARLLKRLEQPPHLLLSEADASVSDREVDKFTVLLVLLDQSLDDDLTPFRELDGVVAEVDQDLTQSQWVTLEMGRDRGVDVEDQFQTFSRRLL